MLIGILSDTHDELARTQIAVKQLIEHGAEALVHCGDLTGAEIVTICAQLPFYFTFGNHDSDSVTELKEAAAKHNAHCLGWGGEIELASKRIAIVHGHLTFDLRPLLDAKPDYMLTGHYHIIRDEMHGSTRRINPGALHRADEF